MGNCSGAVLHGPCGGRCSPARVLHPRPPPEKKSARRQPPRETPPVESRYNLPRFAVSPPQPCVQLQLPSAPDSWKPSPRFHQACFPLHLHARRGRIIPCNPLPFRRDSSILLHERPHAHCEDPRLSAAGPAVLGPMTGVYAAREQASEFALCRQGAPPSGRPVPPRSNCYKREARAGLAVRQPSPGASSTAQRHRPRFSREELLAGEC